MNVVEPHLSLNVSDLREPEPAAKDAPAPCCAPSCCAPAGVGSRAGV
jgi:hypothetical protein